MFPLPTDFKLCHLEIAGALQEFRNHCFKREHVESNAFNSWKLNTFVFLSPCFFKKAKGKLLSPPFIRVCPSVCQLCHLLRNYWTKFNQIWCVSYSHEWGTRQHFLPCPLGPWGGVKRSNIIIFYYKVNFKDFYNNICVCTHK